MGVLRMEKNSFFCNFVVTWYQQIGSLDTLTGYKDILSYKAGTKAYIMWPSRYNRVDDGYGGGTGEDVDVDDDDEVHNKQQNL